jgi:hypothetical protein
LNNRADTTLDRLSARIPSTTVWTGWISDPESTILVHTAHSTKNHWQLVEERPFDRIRGIMDAFVAEVAPAGADGQVCRAAARFGIIAAGGETAQRYGIVPWPANEAIGAAKRLAVAASRPKSR